MSKFLNIQPILNPGGIGFPVKYGTWVFLQLAYNEQFNAIMNNLILSQLPDVFGDNVYILYGCDYSIIVGQYFINPGAVYSNGEIYLCPAQIVAVTSNPLVANLQIVPYQDTDAIGDQVADPVAFIGAGSSNVHDIRQVQFVTGVSGTGNLNGGASIQNDLSNFIKLINKSWVSAPISITPTGGGTFFGTLASSRYKIVGNTYFYCLKYTGVSVVGTVSSLNIALSTPLGRTFQNPNSFQRNGVWFQSLGLLIELLGTDVQLNVALESGANFTGSFSNNNLEINIVAELV